MAERTYNEALRALRVFEAKAATRLLSSSRAQRAQLYGEIYDEFFRSFPELHREVSEASARNAVFEAAFAKSFMSPSSIVAEIGSGHGELAVALSPHCRYIYSVDVSDLVPSNGRPANFKHIQTDGFGIPLSDGSVDIVISSQMMEHLHPDDVTDQLREIWRVLKQGGCYICTTPNRLYGPHDISGEFTADCRIVDGCYVAYGLHLKEYTNVELSDMCRNAGFHRTKHFAGMRGKYLQIPLGILAHLEKAARRIPVNYRKRSSVFRATLGARVVADK